MFLLVALISVLCVAWCLLRAFGDARDAALSTAVTCGILLAWTTEGLSAFHSFTAPYVAIAWALIGLAALVVARTLLPAPVRTTSHDGFDWAMRAGLAAIALLFSVVVLTALAAPPGGSDPMDYHLPRAAMWISNRSVAFFPTDDPVRHLLWPPWAEYALANSMLLARGDRLVNLVEAGAAIGSAVAISAIARELGASGRGQVIAALLCATLPEGILEASGSNNGWPVAFWCAASVYYLLRWKAEHRVAWAALASGAIALAMFSKGTAYPLLPPLSLLLLLPLRRAHLRPAATLATLVVVAVVSVNGPQYARNLEYSGSPLGMSVIRMRWKNETSDRVTIGTVASGVLRNLAMHLGTPIEPVNRRIQQTVVRAVRAIGQDPDDPATTWPGDRFQINRFSRDEYFAGNLGHLLLGVAALAALLFIPSARRRDRLLLAVGLIASFISFAALSRWTVWQGRQHLTLFVIGCALLGTVLGELRWRLLVDVASLAFTLVALALALKNSARPLLPEDGVSVLTAPRQALYFRNTEAGLEGPYAKAAAEIMGGGCHDVAIDRSLRLVDYPLFALLGADGRGTRIRYSAVHNGTTRFADPSAPRPCALVCLRCADLKSAWARYRRDFSRASIHGDNVLFADFGAVPNLESAPPTVVTKDLINDMHANLETILRFDPTPIFEILNARHDRALWARFEPYTDRPSRARDLWESTTPQRSRAERSQPVEGDAEALGIAAEALAHWARDYPHQLELLRAGR